MALKTSFHTGVVRAVAALLCAATLAGCGTLGTRIERTRIDPGAPTVREVVQDLAANEAAVKSFRAAGSFTLESPEFDSIKKFRGGRILFRRPTDLYVQGNHRITNITLFRLTSSGEEFVMVFPTEKEQSFYQIEGEQFEDVPFTVSPADVALEMFLPEQWGELGRRDVRLVEYSAETGEAMLEVGPRRAPRRRVWAARVGQLNPRWVVVRNVRLTDEGRVLAHTESTDYHELEGVSFPAVVDAWFPTEETRMRFEMRNIRLNVDLPDEEFDVQARAAELGLLKAGTAEK